MTTARMRGIARWAVTIEFVARGHSPARFQAIDAAHRAEQGVGVGHVPFSVGKSAGAVKFLSAGVRPKVGAGEGGHVARGGALPCGWQPRGILEFRALRLRLGTRFMARTNCRSLPPTRKASAVIASLPDATAAPVSSCLTATRSPLRSAAMVPATVEAAGVMPIFHQGQPFGADEHP